MTEQDPRKYRGGAHEPPDAKGGPESWADNEGVVPREMIDDEPRETGDPQALGGEVQGQVTGHDHADQAIDREGGDQSDAARFGGTGADVEDLEAGRPISRVDQPNLAAQSDKGPRTG